MIADVRPVPQHSKCFPDLTLVYWYSPTLTMTPHATHCCLSSRMLLHSGWCFEWPTEWVCNRWRPRPALSCVCAEPNVLVHRGCAGWAGLRVNGGWGPVVKPSHFAPHWKSQRCCSGVLSPTRSWGMINSVCYC